MCTVFVCTVCAECLLKEGRVLGILKVGKWREAVGRNVGYVRLLIRIQLRFFILIKLPNIMLGKMAYLTFNFLSIKASLCTWGDPKETGKVLWWAGLL